MGRPWLISNELRSGLWDRYLCGEPVLYLSMEMGVTADALRKALRAEALCRGYAPGLRLDEIRKSKERKSRTAKYDEGRSAFGVCKFCGCAVACHKRCKRCDVLLHELNTEYTCSCGKQHGVYGRDGLCVACGDRDEASVVGICIGFSNG